MPGNYLLNPLEFLLSTLFSIYILAVMLRFLLQWARADFYNPISQFLVKVTNPPLIPLRRLIPGIGGIDWAAVLLMLVLQMASIALIIALRGGTLAVGPLALFSLAELVNLLFNVFIFAILIQVVISWINPGAYNPLISLLYSLNEPLLRPARRVIPPIGGLDLSPLAVIIALQVLKMLVVPPLRHLAGGA
ncbi:YggT family protein [Ectothiorhodospiraceae bacterium 2226]|nr:YggT family protein [Ectothiorhodospiraceae bacterium 2226]